MSKSKHSPTRCARVKAATQSQPAAAVPTVFELGAMAGACTTDAAHTLKEIRRGLVYLVEVMEQIETGKQPLVVVGVVRALMRTVVSDVERGLIELEGASRSFDVVFLPAVGSPS